MINATAYTAVDKAEEDQETADLVNHLAVANIASICNELDCWLIHFSTDYVFDGDSSEPYKENDKTNPQGIYGETKLRGEMVIQTSGCKHIIIRTAWVFSEYGNNFLTTMLRLGSERNELSIVGDQIGCPTYAQDIAVVTVIILQKLNLHEDLMGVYHYCGKNEYSWFDFATKIFDCVNNFGLNSPQKLWSIETCDYPTAARRPSYSVLSCESICNKFGIKQSEFDVGLKSAVAKILAAEVL